MQGYSDYAEVLMVQGEVGSALESVLSTQKHWWVVGAFGSPHECFPVADARNHIPARAAMYFFAALEIWHPLTADARISAGRAHLQGVAVRCSGVGLQGR